MSTLSREEQDRRHTRRNYAANEGLTEVNLLDIGGNEVACFFTAVLPRVGDIVTVQSEGEETLRVQIESVGNFIVDKAIWRPLVGTPLSHVQYAVRKLT